MPPSQSNSTVETIFILRQYINEAQNRQRHMLHQQIKFALTSCSKKNKWRYIL